MKDTYYFSHDYNTRNDIKIKRLMQKHGMEGYGVFWAIVEELYNNANALPTDYDTIAYEMHVSTDIVKSIINDFDLFVIDGNEFGSSSVERRLNERAEKSKKARQSADKRWSKYRSNTNAMRTHSEGNAIKERKGKEKKETKEKERKVIKDNDSDFFEVIEYPNFDDFWNLYDKKVDRTKAEAKWKLLSQKEKEEAVEYIPAYKLAQPDKKFRRNPETFINNKTWQNEIITNNGQQTKKHNLVFTADDFKR